jgi:hypothetical protein
MQFAKLAQESSCLFFALTENYSSSKPLNVSPEKSHILSCDTVVANERYVIHLFNPSALPSIRRIIGLQQRSTFQCLPSPRTEEFEIPYDEIATIYLKNKIIHKLMIRFF